MGVAGREIAVVGAGVGGLAAALALARRGARVTVFEAAPALGEVGAGLQIGPNSVAVLEALGLRDAAEAVASLPEAIELRDGLTGPRGRPPAARSGQRGALRAALLAVSSRRSARRAGAGRGGGGRDDAHGNRGRWRRRGRRRVAARPWRGAERGGRGGGGRGRRALETAIGAVRRRGAAVRRARGLARTGGDREAGSGALPERRLRQHGARAARRDLSAAQRVAVELRRGRGARGLGRGGLDGAGRSRRAAPGLCGLVRGGDDAARRGRGDLPLGAVRSSAAGRTGSAGGWPCSATPATRCCRSSRRARRWRSRTPGCSRRPWTRRPDLPRGSTAYEARRKPRATRVQRAAARNGRALPPGAAGPARRRASGSARRVGGRARSAAGTVRLALRRGCGGGASTAD